jgi:hypothetical protein
MAGIPWQSATGSVGSAHGTINLVSEAPLMFLKLTPRLLVPLHTLQVVPKLGTTERCAFERVSRYRSDRWVQISWTE